MRILFFEVAGTPKTELNTVTKDTTTFRIHEVLPKETKWRLAYQYRQIEFLDSLNPEIKLGLKLDKNKSSKRAFIEVILKEILYIIIMKYSPRRAIIV